MKLKQLLSKIAVSALTLSMLASFAASAEEADVTDGAVSEDTTVSDEATTEDDADDGEIVYEYVNQGFNLIDETFLGMADEPKLNVYQPIMNDLIYTWMGGRSILAYYMGRTMVATDPEKAIFEDSPSLVLYNQVDTRAWMLNDLGIYPDPAVSMEITFRIDNLGFTKDGETDAAGNPMDSAGWLQFCITEETANTNDKTGSETWGGKLFIVTATEEEGVYQLKNNVDKPIAKLNKGEVYKLGIVFDGTNQYYFFLNDEYVAGSQSTFKVPVTLISAFRFDMYSVANPTPETFSEVTLGKILFDTCDFGEEGTLDEPSTPATTEPTVAATEAPTVAPTEEPKADDSKDDKTTEETGCGGVIAGSASMVALMGIAIVVLKKRR